MMMALVMARMKKRLARKAQMMQSPVPGGLLKKDSEGDGGNDEEKG